jgi:hypothetical protein
MTNIKQKYCALLIVFLCFGLSGCWFALGGAAGGGTAIYLKGRLQETTAHNMLDVHNATLLALKNQHLPIIEETKKTDSTSIRSRYEDDTNIWITIDYKSVNSSVITIRVGILGDESRSRDLWDQIRKQL